MIKVYIYPFNKSELNDNMFLSKTPEHLFSTRENVQLIVFKHLKERCSQEGIELHTCDFFDKNSSEKSIHVFMRHWPFEHLMDNKSVVLGAYYIWEPPILVNSYPADQFNSLDRIVHAFHKVYAIPTIESIRSAVPHLSQSIKIEKTFLYQPYDGVAESLWKRNERKFLTLIANFNICSLREFELYTERLKAVKYFSDKGLDLYGANWEQVASYREFSWKSLVLNLKRIRNAAFKYTLHGELMSFIAASSILRAWTGRAAPYKLKTLSEYQFCVCYESSEFEGFVTEKIFDCMVAGTIPIYLGAPDIEKYVPKSCFIDRRKFSTYKSLFDYLLSLSPTDIDNYKASAKLFFSSHMYKQHSKDVFARQFIDDVKALFNCNA